MIALPCRHVIVDRSGYHGCALFDCGSLCQACNPNLEITTIKGITWPTELSFRGNPDVGNLEVRITDCESKVTSVERPAEMCDLDDQCPAGYTWKQVQAKSTALHSLCPNNMDEKDAQRINTMIHNIHKTNVKEIE